MTMYIEPTNLTFSDTKAFFTTRNIVVDNNKIDEVLANKFNISKNKLYLPLQKHTNKVHVLESDIERVVADAVVTSRKNIFIGILVADCVPVLLYDRHRDVVAAVQIMCRRFHSVPENISVAIGPSIRKCSYEVGWDVKSEVQRATGEGDYYFRKEDRYFIDISTANKLQALTAGILESNIWQSEECTFCNPQKYYSYRYDGAGGGRQGGFIGMW
jgi:copper oxidase (laccase) domain-containing protein